MYAVIKTGGKQYKVQQGDRVRVELLKDVTDQSKVTFNEVLMIGGVDQPRIGAPVVKGATVEAEVLGARVKGAKTLHFIKGWFGFTRRSGHRQKYTEVRITGITA